MLRVEQSLRYAQHLRRQGLKPGLPVSPGFHPFDILAPYADPASEIQRVWRDLV